MTAASARFDRLYELLPVLYREQDADRGYPLRALLRIIEVQADLVDRDIGRLFDDFFIETCRPWVIPYIGDLVGNRLLFDESRARGSATAEQLFDDLTGPDLRPPIAIRTRADVAKTISYRRRKGTLPILEELARDVTGWPAHAVEFFELLGWTQHLEHVRLQSRWADVRNVDRADRVDGPFDELSHTVDVRRITHHEGWHDISNVGFFFFRLGAFELSHVPARVASAPWRYHFSPLGNPAPLFSRWRREGDEAGLATELHVPAPIRRAFFYEDLQRYRHLAPTRPDFTDLYGLPDPDVGGAIGVAPEASFFIVRNGVPVTPTANPGAPPEVFSGQIVCHQLDAWPAAQPAGQIIAVDPDTGRLVVGDGWPDATERIDVYYHYGFPSNLGGGPYERHEWLVDTGKVAVRRLFVQEGAAATNDTFPSVVDAVTAWVADGRPNALITIRDSRSYAVPAQIDLPNEGFLIVEAANGVRPLLQTEAAGLRIDSDPAAPGDPTREAAFTLSGVVLEGHVHVVGDLARLRLLHATLIPGRRLTEDGAPELTEPSIVVDAGAPGAERNTELRVESAYSIVGPIVLPEHARGAWILDGVLDGLDGAALAYQDGAGGPGPDLHAERATVFGGIAARSLDLSESIVTGGIEVVRTQHGCVRFSYVRPGSHTARRYRCQPDLAISKAVDAALERNAALTPVERQQIRTFIEQSVVPSFVAERYGRPAYAQLRIVAPVEIGTGAEDGSEMGVYSHLKQPQRLDNLRLRLEEYLPFGLDAGNVFVT